MSAPSGPDGKPGGSPAAGDAGKRSTVGVYDRPESADRPSMLPKIITAVIVVLMLVLTWLFWPKAAAAATPTQPGACAPFSKGSLPPQAAAQDRLAAAQARPAAAPGQPTDEAAARPARRPERGIIQRG